MFHLDADYLDASRDGPVGSEAAGWALTFPASVQAAIAMGGGAWPLAVQRAINAGIRDVDRLTDLAFWMHVPDLGGKPIPMHHGRSEEWVALWKFLRTGVGSLLRGEPAGPKPGGGGNTAKLPFTNIRRVWVHTNTQTIVGSSTRAATRRKQLCDLAPTDIMIGTNDVSSAHAAHRGNRAFSTYRSAHPAPALHDALDELKSCGAAIHFMTWITPRARYCRGLADTMFELCARNGARSLMLDAEEPWMRSAETGSHAEFVDTVFKPLIAGRPCCVGVSHIVYGSHRKLDPLIAACDYILPQAYSGADSGRLPKTAMRRWGGAGKTVVMGLSAMQKVGSSGMRTDLAVTDGFGTVREVYYWSFGHLRASTARFEVAKAAADRARATQPQLPPPPLCHIPWPLF